MKRIRPPTLVALLVLGVCAATLTVPSDAPALAGPRVKGAKSSPEVKALGKWFKRYLSAKSSRHRYFEYYPQLWSLRDIQQDRAEKDPAYYQLFGGLRAYRLGHISGTELALVIRKNKMLRRRGGKELFYNYARLLEVFGAARNTGSPKAAELFLRIATFQFKKKRLQNEIEAWDRIRKYRPTMVRREAVLHLTRMATYPQVRGYLVSVLDGTADLDGVAFSSRQREIALNAFDGVDLKTLDLEERKRLATAFGRMLRSRTSFWIRLAAARQLGRLGSESTTTRPLLDAMGPTLDRLADRPFSIDLRVAREFIVSVGKMFQRQMRLETPDVDAAVIDEAVAKLLDRLYDPRTPIDLGRAIVTVFRDFPHIDAAKGLIRLLEMPDVRDDLRNMAWKALMHLTGIKTDSAKAWLEHHRRLEGAAKFGTMKELVKPNRKKNFLSWADRHYYATSKLDFYGIPVVGKRVIFVVDRSGSMSDPLDRTVQKISKLDRAKEELIKVIKGFDEHTAFNIFFFASSIVKFDEGRLFVAATDSVKEEAADFLKRVGNSGPTNLMGGILAAFGKQAIRQSKPLPIPGGHSLASHGLPDQVIVLSDGVPTEGHYFDLEDIADEVRRLNTARTVRVDVVAFGDESEPDNLGEIARQNGGTLTILPKSFAKEHETEVANMEKELKRFLRSLKPEKEGSGKGSAKGSTKAEGRDPSRRPRNGEGGGKSKDKGKPEDPGRGTMSR